VAPLRTLAYNRRLERFHVRPTDPIASGLFLAGVPLDRVHLRPRFWPWREKNAPAAERVTVIEGRPASPTRAKFHVLSPYPPWPLSHGGAVRIYYLLREAALEFDIHLYVFDDGSPLDPGPLTGFCRRITAVRTPPYREPRWASLAPPEVCERRSAAMRRALEGARPLQVEYTQLGEYEGDILVEHDVSADLHAQVHARRRSLGSWWDLYRWRRFERRAVRKSLPVVMSEKDAKLLGAPCRVIPNGVDLERFRPSPEAPGRRLLFVGSVRHFPNATALTWFWELVWPLLRDCRLTVIAGPDAREHWQAFTGQPDLPSGPGLHLHGFIADVKPFYDEANLAIVPTQVSAGTNLKVLEAMATRRAVVSTSSGCAGLGLRDGESVVVADTPKEFAAAIERLLADDEDRSRIAANARRLAEERYSWSALGRLQRELWRQYARPALLIESGPSPEPEFARYPAFIASLEGRVLGHLTWRQTAGDERELLWLYTEPAWRRHGIAVRLLEHAVSMGPAAWLLEVRPSNPGAIRLYARLGFFEYARRRDYYSEPPEDAILMRREQVPSAP
jgi:glycosyltransferase involved in cell wall biosynthesis